MTDSDFVVGLTMLSAAILLGGAAVGSAMGVGRVGASYVEGAARQPALADNLQVRTLIIAGVLDAVPMIAVGIAMMLLFANPFLAGGE